MTRSTRAYIGIGSNLEDPFGKVGAGISALGRLPDSRVVSRSSLYRSAPVGIVDQPEFVNAVCAVDTSLTPQELLRELHDIEHAYGRERGPIRGGPRTLDLDILLYDDLQMASSEITIPHPRLHERAFVLCPLSEIAPTLRVPGRGPMPAMLSACAAQVVARVPDGAVEKATIR